MSRKPLSVRNYDHPPRSRPPPTGAAKGKKKERFPFSILDKNEIVSTLNQIFKEIIPGGTLVLSEDDLKNPVAERIQMVYFKLLNFSIGVSVDSLKQASFDQAISIEHPELMEDFTYRIQFFRLMKKFMQTCLVVDFKLADIMQPDSKRTCRNISAIVNFIKFHFNIFIMDTSTKAIVQTRDILAEENLRQVEANREVQHTLAMLKKQRSEEQELETEIRSKLSSQAQEMQELKTREVALKQQYDISCEQKVQSDDRLATLTRELEKCSFRVDDLSKHVVTSPDRLKATLSHLQELVRDAVSSSKETEALQRMWESLASQAHQIPEGVLKALNENLDALTNKVEKRNELSMQYGSIEELMRRQNQLLREATAKHQSLLRHLKMMEEEADRVACQDGKISHSRGTEDLHRDILLLQQEVYQREQEKERFMQLGEEEKVKVAEYREHMKVVREEMAEMTTKLLTAVHGQLDQYKDIMKSLGVN